MTATERFKKRFSDLVERVCVLEEQLEQAQARIVELEEAQSHVSNEHAPGASAYAELLLPNEERQG